MEKINKDLINHSIYYFLLFYFLPFILLGTGFIYSGLEFFLLYMLIIFPISFVFFLLGLKKMFKDKMISYKRNIVILWGIFLLFLIFIPSYIFILMHFMLSGFKGF
jgi:hypothetical protein